jgi:endonuclease YncB( thermonuclease family)
MSGEAFDWSRHTAANTPRLDAKGVRGVARIVGIHDGDTVKALVRIPWAGGAVRMVTLRLAGIDAPELKTGEAGAHSTARLVRWLCGHHPGDVGAYLAGNVVLTHVDITGTDKYGRSLAVLTDAQGQCINEVMIQESCARPY